MMKIAILTDNAALLSKKIQQRDDLFVVNLPIVIYGMEYREEVENERKFIERKVNNGEFLSLGNIKVADIEKLLKKIQEQGFTDVICVNVSQSLSSIFMNIQTFKYHTDIPKIHQIMVYGLGYQEGSLVSEIATMIDQGKSVSDLLEYTSQVHARRGSFVIMDNIRHLERMGYVPKLTGKLPLKALMMFNNKDEFEIIDTYSNYRKLIDKLIIRLRPLYQENPDNFKLVLEVGVKFSDWNLFNQNLRSAFPKAKIRLTQQPKISSALLSQKNLIVSWGQL